MKQIVVYVSAGIIAYGVFLITQAPAAFLFDQARQFQPGLQTEQVSGTFWQGAAQGLRLQSVQTQQRILSNPLNLSWRWRPLALFSGDLEFQTYATASELDLTANVAIDGDRQVKLSALEGTISLSQVIDLIKASALIAFRQDDTALMAFRQDDTALMAFRQDDTLNMNILAGDLQLSEGELAVDAQGRIVFAGGEVLLREMRLALGDNLHLGDYTARLTTKDQLIEAEITDQGGPIELSGILQLKPGGNYRCSGQIGVRENATPELRQMLALLGRTAADGKWRFNFTGTIRQ